MTKIQKATKPVFGDIKPYQTGSETIPEYAFPFTVLDDTPGGANLGRIEWSVELHPAPKRRGENRKRLREIWVWASQTRDMRYRGKTFKFETWAEYLCPGTLPGRREGFAPWRVGFCSDHRNAVILEAYPDDHHTKLIVAPSSSISCEVRFR